MKRNRKEKDFVELFGVNVGLTDKSFDHLLISDEIDKDYIDQFYESDSLIHYKYGIVKPNEIVSLIKENTVDDDANIDRSKPRTEEIIIPNTIDNQQTSKISELDKKILEQYFINENKPSSIAMLLKIPKDKIYKIVENVKKFLIKIKKSSWTDKIVDASK